MARKSALENELGRRPTIRGSADHPFRALSASRESADEAPDSGGRATRDELDLQGDVVDAEAVARVLREENDELKQRLAAYEQVIHELRTQLNRRDDTAAGGRPVEGRSANAT